MFKLRVIYQLFMLHKLKVFIAATGIICSTFAWSDVNYNGQNRGDDNDFHSHYAKDQKSITKANVSSLQHVWAFDTNLHTPLSPIVGGTGALWATNAGISAKITLSDDGIIYLADNAGGLYAIDKVSGNIIWQKYVPDYGSLDMPLNSVYAQPTISGSVLYVGSDKSQVVPACTVVSGPFCQDNKGAIVLAINRFTGDLLWKTKVDSHPAAKIRGGVTVSGNQIIVPVSSWEETYADTENKSLVTGNPADANLPYPCCSFRGSIVSLDKSTGNILWKTYTAPGDNLPAGIMENGDRGYYGNAVWIENPIIDKKRGRIYVATGENYSTPKKAMLCSLHLQDPAHYAAPSLPDGFTCDNLNKKVGNYVNSIIALDIKDGKVLNSFQTRQYDAFVEACLRPDFSIALMPPVIGLTSVEGSLSNCPTIKDPNHPGTMLSMAGPDSGFGHIAYVPKVTIESDDISSKKNDDKVTADLIVAGEKAGTLYAINADTFSVVWKTKVGPGGIIGGLQFGLATDGRFVYINSVNSANYGRDGNAPIHSNPLYAAEGEYPGGMYNPVAPQYFAGFDWNSFGTPQAYSGPGVGLIANVEGHIIEPDNTMINTGKRDWALVNPPQDLDYPFIDGVSTYNDNGVLRTRTSFLNKIDLKNGAIIWQRPIPVISNIPMQSPWMNSFWDPTSSSSYGGCHTSPILANDMLFMSCGISEGSNKNGLVVFDATDGKILTIVSGISASHQNEPIVDGKSVYVPTGIAVSVIVNPSFLNMFYGFPGTYGGIDLSTSHKLYKLQLP